MQPGTMIRLRSILADIVMSEASVMNEPCLCCDSGLSATYVIITVKYDKKSPWRLEYGDRLIIIMLHT